MKRQWVTLMGYKKSSLVALVILVMVGSSLVPLFKCQEFVFGSNVEMHDQPVVPSRLLNHTQLYYHHIDVFTDMRPQTILNPSKDAVIKSPSINSKSNDSSTFYSATSTQPRLKTLSPFDVVIDEIFPRAIEINRTSISYLLNFTIVDAPGSSSGVVQNLTLFRIEDSSEFYKISWYNFQYLGETNYSLQFTLNQTLINSLTLGYYNLSIYANVSGVESFSTVSLPVKDLSLNVMSLSPSEFNNKYDYNQTFDIKVEFKETVDGVSYNSIPHIPSTYNSDGYKSNPSILIISSTKETSARLYFSSFVSNNSLEGTYTFNSTLLAEDARLFDEADHILSVSVMSSDGISEDANTTIQAKSTILLVRLKNIHVGSKTFDWANITNSGKEHATVRVNLNTSIKVNYDIYTDAGDLYTSAGQVVVYQDPNRPTDPFAVLSNTSFADGFDSIILTSNVTSLSSGYPLFLYVRGHQTSQANYTSNVTIFWDLLDFQLDYFDNKGETGVKGLGLDVNEVWTLNLSILYVSDGSLAYSSTIQYRYPEENASWITLTDGKGLDAFDGRFVINRSESSAKIILLEVRIINGSTFESFDRNFVNMTQGDNIFNLTVIWTYLNINMTSLEDDARLGTLQSTDINITISWAHNSSLPYNGIVYARDYKGRERAISITNGQGIWTGVVNDAVGRYRYSISRIDDTTYGITSFFNSSGGDTVYVDIIWDAIEFTFSNTYDNTTEPLLQTWEASLNSSWGFFVNINTNATLYVYGRHLYDNSSFQGVALLYALTTGENFTLSFNTNGIAIWEGDLSSVKLPVEFSVMAITVSTEIDWGIMRIGTWIQVEIVWDRLIVTLESKKSYSHGTWADIYVKYSYEVSPVAVNPLYVSYDLTLHNGTIMNISWTHFRDYSFQAVKRDYIVTNFYDARTGLLGADILFQWDGEEAQIGNLSIYWVDDKTPEILDRFVVELGNGTVLIIIIATDNCENWNGTGISEVALIDKRSRVDEIFPLNPKSTEILPGIFQYIFKYNYNQIIPGYGDYFAFSYNETLEFALRLSDEGTPEFPDGLGSSNLMETNIFSIIAGKDVIDPVFIAQNGLIINASYLTDAEISSVPVTDGTLEFKVIVQDKYWSGLSNDSVIIVVSDLSNNLIYQGRMNTSSSLSNIRSELVFSAILTLNVLHDYEITVIVSDNSGNRNNHTITLLVEDRVAPRVLEVQTRKTGDRQLSVTVFLEENGLGVDFVRFRLGNSGPWYNLSRTGGYGGALTRRNISFSGIIPLPLGLDNIIFTRSYEFMIWVKDRSGNENFAFNIDYSYDLVPLLFEPWFIVILGLIIVIGAVIGIKVASRTEGYDMKRLISESERISREEVLTLMDDFALGVTVNFFDQIQGPVPVIWEPQLLEDQEQVMLDLSDKSFSTLEFTGEDEYERSGTFDFSTGSYECTALGYSFSVENPEARGGKENLTIVLLLRREWGQNLLIFQDELLGKLREIRVLVENKQPPSVIEAKARELRELVSRLMIAFNHLYLKEEKEDETESEVE